MKILLRMSKSTPAHFLEIILPSKSMSDESPHCATHIYRTKTQSRFTSFFLFLGGLFLLFCFFISTAVLQSQKWWVQYARWTSILERDEKFTHFREQYKSLLDSIKEPLLTTISARRLRQIFAELATKGEWDDYSRFYES